MARNSPDIGAIINEIQKQGDQIASLIDPGFFARLASDFGIPENKRREALQRACGAAGVYKAIKHLEAIPTNELSFSAVRNEVLAIERLAKELVNGLSKISGAAWGWLEVPERLVDTELALNWNAITESRFGHVIYRRPPENGAGEAATYLHLHQIKQGVSALAKMAEFAVQNLRPQDRGGRPRNEAIYQWVSNIAAMWKECVGNSFTLEEYGGKPISSAAGFCERLMQALDATVKFPQIATAMRKVIHAAKPGRGRKRQ